MEYILISISAFLASFLSFFSGFGLGTLLMPVTAIFFPLPVAIGLTAIVHLIHNTFKAAFLWKAIDWKIVVRFGILALIAAIPGAFILRGLSDFAPLKKYSFLFLKGEISVLHITIGLLLIVFATLELFSNKKWKVKNLYLGGILSGFFGGFSGYQGAFRSIFLVHTDLDKKGFIGTSAFIAIMVDVVRVIVYFISFKYLLAQISTVFSGVAIGSALAGICLGMLLLNKILFPAIRILIVILLYVIGIIMIAGII